MEFIPPKVGDEIKYKNEKFVVISSSKVYEGAYLVSFLHRDYKIEIKVEKNG